MTQPHPEDPEPSDRPRTPLLLAPVEPGTPRGELPRDFVLVSRPGLPHLYLPLCSSTLELERVLEHTAGRQPGTYGAVVVSDVVAKSFPRRVGDRTVVLAHRMRVRDGVLIWEELRWD